MVTSTSIDSSQLYVVDQQTTYFLNQFGHTTAVLPRLPTVVLTVTPAPYTVQAQEPRPSTATSNRIALPSTVADGLSSGWKYTGCFIDNINARVLPLQMPNNTNLTAHKCVSSCYQLGYSVAGLEYRRQCFCGDAIYNGGTLAPIQTDCNMTCTGNAMEICGAHNRVSTYSNATLKIDQPEAVQGGQTAIPTTTTSTMSTIVPSPTVSISDTPKVPVTVAAVIGAAGGVAIMIALVYLCWRIRSNRRKKSLRQASQNTAQAWSPAGSVPSWEGFLKATEEHYAKVDEGNHSALGHQSIHVDHRPSIPGLWKMYELQLNHQRVYQAGSDKYSASPTRYLPTTSLALQGHLGQPTSILKRPATPGVTSMVQGTFEMEDREVSQDVPATGNLARAKKGVRFGVNQIREFGRTPFIGSGSDSSVWSG